MNLIVSGGGKYANRRRIKQVLTWLKPRGIACLSHPLAFADLLRELTKEISASLERIVPLYEQGARIAGLGTVGAELANLEMLSDWDGLVVAFRGDHKTTSLVIEALKQKRSVLLVDGGPKKLVEMLISNHELKIIQEHQHRSLRVLRQQNAELRLMLEIADEE